MTEKEWVENKVGKGILAGLSDDVFHHFYRGMHDYDMSFYDADRWAWLNTLFGYDIGAERALDIITWYDNNGMDVLEINADDKETLKNICSLELGLHFNYKAWPNETPDAIRYDLPEYIKEANV